MCQWAKSRQKMSKEFWHGTFSELSGHVLAVSPVAAVSRIGTRQLTAMHGGQARCDPGLRSLVALSSSKWQGRCRPAHSKRSRRDSRQRTSLRLKTRGVLWRLTGMTTPAQPSPDLFFDTLTAYQKTAALKAAIDLNLFTALADAPATAAQIAKACNAAERGVRILCDYLTVLGFLQKSGDKYNLTLDSTVFLSRKSPGYAGGVAEFLLSDHLTSAFKRLTEAVRKGGTAESQQGSTTPEHPMWMTFAQSMGGLMAQAAAGLAELQPLDPNRPTKVLDISASHGV